MKLLQQTIVISLGALYALTGSVRADYNTPTKMQWWADSRFGMFIHFGSYSYEGHGEWAFFDEKWSKSAYQTQVSSKFNPVNFNATAIVAAAKNAGQKYIVITAKHHEGFAMWDSNVASFTDAAGTTQYNLYDYTPFKRDILAELKSACDAQGIKFCLYYSIMDWNHRSQTVNYTTTFTDIKTSARSGYIADMKAQLKELITKYNPAILWFDGDWCQNLSRQTSSNWWNSSDGLDLYNYLIGLSPNLIINERVKRDCGLGDYRCPEQTVPSAPMDRAWETNETMNGAWGYDSSKENNYKSSKSLIQELATVASREGNFLLNIGPKGDGSMTTGQQTILTAFANWTPIYGESIYGTTRNPFGADPSWGTYTKKPGKLYAHVFTWPTNGQLQIDPLANTINSIYLLNAPQTPLNYTLSEGGFINVAIPTNAPNASDSVVVVDVAGTPTPSLAGPIASGTYSLVVYSSGAVLEPVGGGTAAGTYIDQNADSGANYQRWVLTDLNNGGYYKLINLNSGLSMDISGASTADGASAIEWSYSGSSNQQFKVVPQGGGYYSLVPRHSGKCLGVRGGSNANQALIEQQTFTNADYQVFQIR